MSTKIIKNPSRDLTDEIRKMLQEPKQDQIWMEKFVSLVRELVN